MGINHLIIISYLILKNQYCIGDKRAMHKITKIEEEKLCEVMEIIEKAATLMEENDLETGIEGVM